MYVLIEQHTHKVKQLLMYAKADVCLHPYLQAVNVHGVQFGFISLDQDDALLHLRQMLLQIVFHLFKAIEQQ